MLQGGVEDGGREPRRPHLGHPGDPSPLHSIILHKKTKKNQSIVLMIRTTLKNIVLRPETPEVDPPSRRLVLLGAPIACCLFVLDLRVMYFRVL